MGRRDAVTGTGTRQADIRHAHPAQGRQDGFTTSLPLLGIRCMMPLVDPRRASSQAETDSLVPRTSLSHRLAKVSQTEADRTKAADGKK